MARLIYIHHKDSFFKAQQQCRSERNTLIRLTAGHRGEGVQEPGSSLRGLKEGKSGYKEQGLGGSLF